LNWIVKLWRARQRRIDLEILWPICKENARDIQHAREAFYIHAQLDPAWCELSEQEILDLLV
jgi:hypothetical protein